jgi:hypothetical protein
LTTRLGDYLEAVTMGWAVKVLTKSTKTGKEPEFIDVIGTRQSLNYK